MKTKILTIIMSLSMVFSCDAQTYKKNYEKLSILDKSLLLNNIQNKIGQGMSLSVVKGNIDELNNIAAGLDSIYKKHNEDIILYWLAYTEYYKSISELQFKNKKQSENHIRKGIEFINSIKKKNSDDYALLGLMQSFLMQFENESTIPTLFQKILITSDHAIYANKNNPRAYYFKGSFNYYVPKQYGGGTQVENNLIKSIRLSEINPNNSYLPTWGKEDAYAMLIEYYIDKDNMDNAMDLYMEASSKYPNNYQISMLAKKLIRK